MREHSQKQHPCLLPFSIPMRGNEVQVTAANAGFDSTFSIPMRGNEMAARALAMSMLIWFSIPMRGNEITNPFADGPGRVWVFDPHEG